MNELKFFEHRSELKNAPVPSLAMGTPSNARRIRWCGGGVIE